MKMNEVIPKEDLEKARKMLLEAKRPLFFYDDDIDGTTAFLQLYRFGGKKGRGHIIKSTPNITMDHVRYIEESNADVIFILDVALVDREFIQHAKVPIVWVDHHGPMEEAKHVDLSINPKSYTDKFYLPTSYLAWLIAKKDMWLAMLGTVGDYGVPDFADEFAEDYPDLFPKGVKSPEGLTYTTKLGELIKVINANLKGKHSDIMKSVKALSDLENPLQLLNQETPAAKAIYRNYENVKKVYDRHIQEAVKQRKDDDILLVYAHEEHSYSVVAELSNELIWRNPDKVVIVAREQLGRMKCSFRTRDLPPVDKAFARALDGLEGTGGGHPQAVGANIAKADWKAFLEKFRKEMMNELKKST